MILKGYTILAAGLAMALWVVPLSAAGADDPLPALWGQRHQEVRQEVQELFRQEKLLYQQEIAKENADADIHYNYVILCYDYWKYLGNQVLAYEEQGQKGRLEPGQEKRVVAGLEKARDEALTDLLGVMTAFVKRFPKDGQAAVVQFNLAELLIDYGSQKRQEEGITTLWDLLKRYPGHIIVPQVSLKLGRELLKRARFAGAVKALRIGYDCQDPSTKPLLQFHLAGALVEAGNTREAADLALDLAAFLHGDSPTAKDYQALLPQAEKLMINNLVRHTAISPVTAWDRLQASFRPAVARRYLEELAEQYRRYRLSSAAASCFALLEAHGQERVPHQFSLNYLLEKARSTAQTFGCGLAFEHPELGPALGQMQEGLYSPGKEEKALLRTVLTYLLTTLGGREERTLDAGRMDRCLALSSLYRRLFPDTAEYPRISWVHGRFLKLSGDFRAAAETYRQVYDQAREPDLKKSALSLAMASLEDGDADLVRGQEGREEDTLVSQEHRELLERLRELYVVFCAAYPKDPQWEQARLNLALLDRRLLRRQDALDNALVLAQQATNIPIRQDARMLALEMMQAMEQWSLLVRYTHQWGKAAAGLDAKTLEKTLQYALLAQYRLMDGTPAAQRPEKARELAAYFEGTPLEVNALFMAASWLSGSGMEEQAAPLWKSIFQKAKDEKFLAQATFRLASYYDSVGDFTRSAQFYRQGVAYAADQKLAKAYLLRWQYLLAAREDPVEADRQAVLAMAQAYREHGWFREEVMARFESDVVWCPDSLDWWNAVLKDVGPGLSPDEKKYLTILGEKRGVKPWGAAAKNGGRPAKTWRQTAWHTRIEMTGGVHKLTTRVAEFAKAAQTARKAPDEKSLARLARDLAGLEDTSQALVDLGDHPPAARRVNLLMAEAYLAFCTMVQAFLDAQGSAMHPDDLAFIQSTLREKRLAGSSLLEAALQSDAAREREKAQARTLLDKSLGLSRGEVMDLLDGPAPFFDYREMLTP